MADTTAPNAGSQPAERTDIAEFGHLLNRASLVSVFEAGLVDAETARRIGRALMQLEVEFAGQYANIVTFIRDYPALEKRLVQLAGPNASLLHLGRSRQDMISTCVHAAARDCMRATLTHVVELRKAILQIAGQHIDTVIPAYTHGVQAQPTTYAHYLLAIDGSMFRTVNRLLQGHARINMSSLGAGALATSCFQLDRGLLASLLDFDDFIENSFDANQISPVDALLETSYTLSILATQIGQWAQDIHQTYSNSRSWFYLAPGELTSTSSMMPQKRNPRVLELLRELSGRITGKAQTLTLIAHNLQSGMTEIRWSVDLLPTTETREMLELARKMVLSLQVDSKRSLDELTREYSTVTELADSLYRTVKIPFRIGHDFASALTDFGRQRDLAPTDIKFEDAATLFSDMNEGAAFPLTETSFREALDPVAFVASRAGQGGPQRTEVQRMFKKHEQSLEENLVSLQAIRQKAEAAATELTRRIALILDG